VKAYRGTRVDRGQTLNVTEVVVNDHRQQRPLPFVSKWAAERPDPAGTDPTFEWGYGGTGPSDLAASILADHLGRPVGHPLVQRFKDDVVVGLPRDGFVLEADVVASWCAVHRDALEADRLHHQTTACPQCDGAGSYDYRDETETAWPVACELCGETGQISAALAAGLADLAAGRGL
jgi:Family of unknown function (DUF6166)